MAMMKRLEDLVRGIRDAKTACHALTEAGFFPPDLFGSGKRFFFPEVDAGGYGVLRDASHPQSIAQVLSIAHGLEAFLLAESLAQEAAQALTEHHRMYQGAKVPSTTPNIIVWRDKTPASKHRDHPLGFQENDRFFCVWDGWGGCCDLFDAFCPARKRRTAATLDQLSETWNDPQYALSPAEVTSTLFPTIKDKALKDFKNPLKPCLEMANRSTHGIVELTKVITPQGVQDQAISIGFNVW